MAHDFSKGMHWIGHPGSLGAVTDYGMESVTDDIDPKASTSMGGGRRARVSRNRPARSWSMTVPNAHSDDVNHVRTLLAATLPPYQLVTAHAQVSNVLTPERSVWRSLMPGSVAVSVAGAWPLAGGGWSTITALNPSAAFGNQALVRVGPCPTPPVWTGRKVTVSCWLGTARAAGAYVILDWLDAAGVQVGAGVSGNTVTGMDALRRSTVTATPPAGAVACRIGILYAEILGLPQVTWTPAPIPEWSIGEGADRVVIASSQYETTFAVPDNYSLRRGDYSLNFLETGPML